MANNTAAARTVECPCVKLHNDEVERGRDGTCVLCQDSFEVLACRTCNGPREFEDIVDCAKCYVEPCDHERAKRSTDIWRTLSYVGIQRLEATADEPASAYELRNCSACHSTLCREVAA